MPGGCTATPVLSALYWELAACSCTQVMQGCGFYLPESGFLCVSMSHCRGFWYGPSMYGLWVISPRMENHMEKTIENDMEWRPLTLNPGILNPKPRLTGLTWNEHSWRVSKLSISRLTSRQNLQEHFGALGGLGLRSYQHPHVSQYSISPWW